MRAVGEQACGLIANDGAEAPEHLELVRHPLADRLDDDLGHQLAQQVPLLLGDGLRCVGGQQPVQFLDLIAIGGDRVRMQVDDVDWLVARSRSGS
jgi:hypothetical protein